MEEKEGLMALKKKKMEYADWHDIETAAEKLARKRFGRERRLRDWEGKFSGSGDDAPYHDFWHVLVDAGYVENGSITPIDFEEWLQDAMEESKLLGEVGGDWITEVLDILAEVTGRKNVNVRFFW